jgi:hypothetical protein
MRASSHLLFLTLFVAIPALNKTHALTYQWESKTGESPFSLDVPEAWRTWESVKRNGVIAQFRSPTATIEVRSFSSSETTTAKQIVNQKAARLASRYSSVRLLEERDSKYRENLHIAVWEIKSRGRSYREETAVIISDEGPVVVSCMVPTAEYEIYRTHCENAFYSLILDADRGPKDKGKNKISALVIELQKLHYLNMPDNLPVIAPEVLLNTGPKPTVTKPTQYDENYILPDGGAR